MKKIIFTFLVIANCFTLSGCSCSKKEVSPSIKEVVETEVTKNQKVDGIEMTNTSLIVTDGVSKLVTMVTNNTGKDYTLGEYEILIYGENNNILVTIPGYVGEIIKNGETKLIDSSIDVDLSNAKKIEYKVISDIK